MEQSKHPKQSFRDSNHEYYLKFSNWSSSDSNESTISDGERSNPMIAQIKKSRRNLKKTVKKLYETKS